MRKTRERDCGAHRMTTPDVSSQRARFPSGWTLGVLIGGPAAWGWLTLVAHTYATCNVGINATANAGLLLGLPILWAVNTVVFAKVFTSVSGPTWSQRTLGIAAALAALLFLAWLLFAWQGTPSNYPAPICPSNVPPWWPSWIPV